MKNPYIIDAPKSQFDAMKLAQAYESGSNQAFRQLQREEVERQMMMQKAAEEMLPNAIKSGDFTAIIEADPSKGKEYLDMQENIRKMRKGKTLDIFQAAYNAKKKGNRDIAVNLIKKNGASLKRIDPTFNPDVLDSASDDELEDMLEMGLIMSGGNIASQELAEEKVKTQQAATDLRKAQTAKELSKGASKRLLLNEDSGLFEFPEDANPSNEDQIKVDKRNQERLENYTQKQDKHQATLDKNNNMIAIVDALKDPKMKKGLQDYLAWSVKRIPGQEDTTFLAEGSKAYEASVMLKRLNEMYGMEQVFQALKGGIDARMTATEVENLKKTGLTFPAGYNYSQMIKNLGRAQRVSKRNKSDVMKKNSKLPKNYRAIDRVSTFTDPEAKDDVLTMENTGNKKAIKLQSNSLQFL